MRSTPTSICRTPAPHAVRLVALALLDEARRAARRFRKGDGADPELLHDFRVSTRRLRSWLQLWHATLIDSLSPKDERRVRRIARATRSARDLDVHLEWLAQRRDSALPARRADITRIMKALDATRVEALKRARAAAAKLEAQHAQLARRLSTHRLTVDVAEEPEASFGAALATTMTMASDELSARLARIRTPRDHDAIHDARIAAKRLRYLLEPVVESIPVARVAANELRALQDTAGALHDAHVFSDVLANQVGARGAGPSLRSARGQALRSGRLGTQRALTRQLRDRSRREYATLERDWLGDAAAPFRLRIQGIARRCEREGT